MITRISALGSTAALLVLCGCASNNGMHTAANPPASPCLQDTGSRLPAAGATCLPGRSYSKNDIDNTGATTAGGALRLLDPSITVTH